MKNTVQWLAACVVTAALGCVAIAVAQAPPAPPKPGPEHERLGFFVGKWTGEGEVKASPMGPGGKVTSSDDCMWFEGHFAVVCHSTGMSPSGPMKSVGVIGYSAEEKVYTYYGVDNSGMVMTTVPRGNVQGDTWTFDDESMMGGNKVKSRVTIKEVSPTSQSFTMELQGPDGKWMPMMEMKSTKAK
jgi:hypothetical protein